MNRKQWIAGAVLLVVLMILCTYGSVTTLNKSKERGSVGQREPLPDFGYCSSKEIKPCVSSFDLDPGGSMVISVLTNSPENFYIKIKQAENELIYECTRAKEYSIQVSCQGEALPAGEMLDFLVISTSKNTTLAQGNFSIIGMALATPEIAITPTYVPAFDHRPR